MPAPSPLTEPGDLIARHMERLAGRAGSAQLQELLARCGLQATGGRVWPVRGGPISDEDCLNYKRAIREIFGETAYSFARVNFILGGCRCADCRSGQ